jgi:hypothetical protein
MTQKIAGGKAFWTCAGFTLVSALVGATFSVLSLRVIGTGHQHEYALYAASRSVALVLTIIFVMLRRSWRGVVTMAVAMTIVQVFDSVVGYLLHEPSEIYGPALFAIINAALLVWMSRAHTQLTSSVSNDKPASSSQYVR